MKRREVWRKFLDLCRDQVVLNEAKLPKPECGKLIQDRALVGNRVGKNDVESGEAIRCDEEKAFAQVKDFADFAGAEFGYAREIKRGY